MKNSPVPFPQLSPAAGARGPNGQSAALTAGRPGAGPVQETRRALERTPSRLTVWVTTVEFMEVSKT